MSQASWVECSFFAPLRRDALLSDGEPHHPEIWEWLEFEIYTRFGGATRAPGHYHGTYHDPDSGERVSDDSIKYIVAIPDERLNELRTFLSNLCIVLQQKCIYLAVAGRVEFVEAPQHETE